jgi:glycosyltransferase involved in cell wall biosynthesis
MKLYAAIPVLNEWRFVPAVVGQLLKVAERCVILRPSRSQSGAAAELTPIPELDPKVDVLEGNWDTESATRNAGMEYYADADYVFLVDSDEIILDSDLAKLAELARSGLHKVIAVRLFTLWKTPQWRIDPPEDGSIKMVLRRDMRVTGVREVNESAHLSDAWCRHLSYVRTDEEVREKIRLSGHSHEIRPDWYESVWRAWDRNPAMENLHPVHPRAYRRAVKVVDPELESVLSRSRCGWPEPALSYIGGRGA